jgi:hypothetical protein
MITATLPPREETRAGVSEHQLALIPVHAREGLRAALALVDGAMAKAAAAEADAAKARAAAAKVRAAADADELQPVAAPGATNPDRLDALLAGDAPAPAVDHRERARLRDLNEDRADVRRQLLADADALEERAGELHAKAGQARAAAGEHHRAFLKLAETAVIAALEDAFRQLTAQHILTLTALATEASKAGARHTSTGLLLSTIRLPRLSPRGTEDIWPGGGPMLRGGIAFDEAAGYARLLDAISGPAEPHPGA